MISSTSLAFLLTACAAFAQTTAPTAFEVASVKPSAPITSREGKISVGLTLSGTLVEINHTTLADLVGIAYRVKDFQVTGPESTASDHFDVHARIPDGALPEQMPNMLRALLAQRFNLALRHQTKEQSVYALVVAKSGFKLQEAEPGADPPAFQGKGKGGKGAFHYDRKVTLPVFADFLSRFVDRPVVDMTELKGAYEFVLEIPFEAVVKAKIGAEGKAAGSPDTASDPSGSAIFAALQILGLKLEPRKAAMEFLIIDHAERIPIAN